MGSSGNKPPSYQNLCDSMHFSAKIILKSFTFLFYMKRNAFVERELRGERTM